MRAGRRRGIIASAALSSAGGAGSVSYLADFPQITATNNFHTVITATGDLDLSAFDEAEDTAIVVALNWYANGGGAVTYLCTYAGVNLTMMTGIDRSGGSNFGSQLWILQNPPATGQLLCRQTGASNTGRNLWAAATLFSGVDSWAAAASVAGIASGATQNIDLGDGEFAVNAMAAGGNMGSYSQTQRRYSTIGSLRGLNGDASGAGTKAFSSTGGAYNSSVAKLVPAA